jgi:undecaprenyl-diphosphatase
MIAVLLTILLLWRLFEAYHQRWTAAATRLWRWFTSSTLVQDVRQRYPHLWRFLGRRLAPGNYLGLHLTLGLLLSLLALSVFAGIADEVLEQEQLTQFDLALTTALHRNATLDRVAAFKVITDLGNIPVLAALGLGVAAALILHRHWLLLTSWLVTLAGGGLLNLVLKAIFQRSRPELANPFVHEQGWSFPSGHAMLSLITYGMLAYLLVVGLNRYLEKVVIVVAVLLVLLIGFSRLYLGAHYFSDVVAGYAAGTIWLAASISGTEVARRRQQNQPPLPSPDSGARANYNTK